MCSSSFGRSAVCLLLALGAASLAAESDFAPAVGVLVLRNGQVLTGAVTRAGDRYTVSWGATGELHVPARDVEMWCRDLDEAYQRKRAAGRGGSVKDQLELIDWCLRQGLVARAADELLEALARDPKHPAIPALERRIQLAAGHGAPRPKSGRSGPPAVSLDELERTVRQLSSESVERFTAQVQPLLLNRCAASSCHGDSSPSAFRLMRPGWGQSLARRYTQRNLYAVLQNVNRQTPEDSPLLTLPAGAHGPLAAAVFRDADQSQAKLLAEWVRSVSQTATVRAPVPPAAVPDTHLQQASFVQPVPLPPDEATRLSHGKSGGKTTHAVPSTAPAARMPSARGSAGAPAAARDPFDPEAFNRAADEPSAVKPD